VDGETAFSYTASILTSCANDAAQKAGGDGGLPGLPGVESLVEEQTPGGLNEQLVRELAEFGACEPGLLTHAGAARGATQPLAVLLLSPQPDDSYPFPIAFACDPLEAPNHGPLD
jgi:hypothetical protein